MAAPQITINPDTRQIKSSGVCHLTITPDREVSEYQIRVFDIYDTTEANPSNGLLVASGTTIPKTGSTVNIEGSSFAEEGRYNVYVWVKSAESSTWNFGLAFKTATNSQIITANNETFSSARSF